MKTIAITLGLLCFAGVVFADGPVTGPSGTVCESAGGSCKGIPDGINIPYKNNCSKFIQCFLECGCDKECSGGLHFNSKLQVCDWPTSAGCDPGCVNPGIECESPGISCKNVTDGTLIPYENDCTKFIQCSNGCEYSKNCPPGTHFCSQLQACTWPSQAGCDPSYVDPTPGTPGTGCESPGGSCKNITDGTLIPYENDCTKYIQCSNGCEYSRNCPPGTHFCSQLQACTWPSQAGCDPSYVDPTPGTPGTGCESPGGSCKNITDGTLIPYENDCTKYIQCSNGCEYSKNCPPGTHFCSQLQACTWPSQAGCDPSYVDPTPGTPGTGCEFIVDSCKNVKDGTLVPYENDCNKFIECSKGCGNYKKCPSGMHFCSKLQMCTSPPKAGCDPSYTDQPPKPSENVCQSSGGSCANIKDGTFISYKDDCSKFIECSKGCGNDRKL